MATRIYVGNLPYNADNQQLIELFGAFGEVVEASVVTDRDSGQSKGFGFVQMATDDAARNAIQSLNGTMLGNRTIRVNEAQPRPERGGGGGGGGYRSGGGGGYSRESQGGYRDNSRGGYSDRPRRDDFGGRNYSAPRTSDQSSGYFGSFDTPNEANDSYSRHAKGRERERVRRERDY
ncbi:MAG TPA: RNA-binding protein [Ktedonobacterales bacterium]|nr:RNA-binding protein [Ktedonobacterales bacterium]